MRNQQLLLLALITLFLVTSCKKDDDATEEDNTCTETRQIWLDGSAGGFEFVTSEPCGVLRLAEQSVGYEFVASAPFQPTHIVDFRSGHTFIDSAASHGVVTLHIGAMVSDSLVETNIAGGDTTMTISPQNICNIMKTGLHGEFIHSAAVEGKNAYIFNYTDDVGNLWRQLTDTSNVFNVTSIDGIISQNPSAGAYFPYCVTSFQYNVLMKKDGAADTMRLEGTGRLGFR